MRERERDAYAFFYTSLGCGVWYGTTERICKIPFLYLRIFTVSLFCIYILSYLRQLVKYRMQWKLFRMSVCFGSGYSEETYLKEQLLSVVLVPAGAGW